MSQRTERVNKLLVREVSAMLSRELEPPAGCLITVMRAEVTADLKNAKIFISILPEQKTGSALRLLEKYTRAVQKMLRRKLAMKFIPAISWEVDLTNIRYARIDEALKGR